jgi:hypothetical protein
LCARSVASAEAQHRRLARSEVFAELKWEKRFRTSDTARTDRIPDVLLGLGEK